MRQRDARIPHVEITPSNPAADDRLPLLTGAHPAVTPQRNRTASQGADTGAATRWACACAA
ncbi:hypothetical protein KC218_25015, partial [Mycobacterium tuberculosis]|nr:hypothetical protein [Mycobacterium tuberculosis]